MQIEALQRYVVQRNWQTVFVIEDIGCGATERPERERLLKAARKREIDAVLVWRLDRWGRSLVDLVNTLHELQELHVGFISLSEALDLTTATGRAMASLLAVFAEFERDLLRERVKAGIAHARKAGKPHGRPNSTALYIAKVQALFEAGLTKSEIARKLKMSRTSVRRLISSIVNSLK